MKNLTKRLISFSLTLMVIGSLLTAFPSNANAYPLYIQRFNNPYYWQYTGSGELYCDTLGRAPYTDCRTYTFIYANGWYN